MPHSNTGVDLKGWFLAAGCGGALLCAASALADPAKVRTAEARTPIPVAGREGMKTAALKKFRLSVNAPRKIGEMQSGWNCSPQGSYAWSPKFFATLGKPIGGVFRAQMNKAGYPAPARSDSAFENRPTVTADFDVGATLKMLQMNLCNKGEENWGGLWLQLRWEVFSPKLQKVVLDITTEGGYQNEAPERISEEQMFERAYAVAVANLLAEARFVEVMSGAQPEAAAPAERLRIRVGREPAEGMAKNATLIRAAVVTLDSGRGSGSGFYIGREGHLLTNQHVVKDAKFLKVKLATGRELVGEVLQAHVHRDVALVKTESMGAEPLAIRRTEPNIGEDVYAVGSPLGERFSGTLTRGVLSGHRLLEGVRYLQSDVAVLPGSSGGPLLDADGRVIGIAVRAFDAGRANLNLFIPIQEALDALAVDLAP